jgi:hypothetical protein
MFFIGQGIATACGDSLRNTFSQQLNNSAIKQFDFTPSAAG